MTGAGVFERMIVRKVANGDLGDSWMRLAPGIALRDEQSAVHKTTDVERGHVRRAEPVEQNIAQPAGGTRDEEGRGLSCFGDHGNSF